MLYCTTTKMLKELPGTIEAGDMVTVFCKETDAFRYAEVNALLACPAKVTMEPVAGKDDMLVCLGAVIASAENCTILDPSIPVPIRFADRVKAAKAVKRTTRKTRTQRNPAREEADTFSKTEEDPKKAVIPDTAMPKPEFPNKEEQEAAAAEAPKGRKKKKTDMWENGWDEFSDPEAAKLNELIKIRSADVGYSWPTQMLMLQILETLSGAASKEEASETLRAAFRNGEAIWKAVEPHYADVIMMAKAEAKKGD